MNNLIRANFQRLKKDKIFWLVTIGTFVLSLFLMLISSKYVDNLPDGFIFEEYYFNYAPYISMFLVVFVSMFLGTEYSNGTIRNKIIVGKTRVEIYLSNLFTSASVSLIIIVASFTAGLIGIPTLGNFSLDFLQILTLFAVIIFSTITLSAIFTLVGMLCGNRTYTVLLSIVALLVLIISASFLDSRLNEPEFNTSGVVFTTNTQDFTIDNTLEPNPAYLTGIKRTIAEIALEILPTGQSLKVAWVEVENPLRMVIFSAVLTLIVTILGIIFFKKKDIK